MHTTRLTRWVAEHLPDESVENGNRDYRDYQNQRKPGGRKKGTVQKAADLAGTSHSTIRHRIKDVADKAGIDIDLSKPSVEDLKAVEKAAEENIQKQAHKTTARGQKCGCTLYIGDPTLLINWFRARMADQGMTIEQIRVYRTAIDKLIGELETEQKESEGKTD